MPVISKRFRWQGRQGTRAATAGRCGSDLGARGSEKATHRPCGLSLGRGFPWETKGLDLLECAERMADGWVVGAAGGLAAGSSSQHEVP